MLHAGGFIEISQPCSQEGARPRHLGASGARISARLSVPCTPTALRVDPQILPIEGEVFPDRRQVRPQPTSPDGGPGLVRGVAPVLPPCSPLMPQCGWAPGNSQATGHHPALNLALDPKFLPCAFVPLNSLSGLWSFQVAKPGFQPASSSGQRLGLPGCLPPGFPQGAVRPQVGFGSM